MREGNVKGIKGVGRHTMSVSTLSEGDIKEDSVRFGGVGSYRDHNLN